MQTLFSCALFCRGTWCAHQEGDVMDANTPGAALRRKPFRRLIGMIMLLCCMIGLFAAFPLFTHPFVAHAAGSVQINAGGPAASPFVADTDFSGGATASVSNPITTSGVSNPAPQAVYQSNRYGNFTYTIPGLAASSSYTVRLHFAEEYWTAAGKRVFNVSLNGTQVLTNFDIFATAGGEYKAVVEQFSATATGSGTIAIQFVTVTDNAQVNGIEVLAPGSTTPTPTPGAGSVQINAGGPAASPFIADTDFSGGSTASVSNAIDTSGVTNPAPQAVYQSNRYGNFTYTIPGLTASGSYTVRLHFAEEYWTTAGKRVFNVNINGTQVLTNFDIFATAGGEYKAVVEQFSATATGSGTIAIQFVTVTDNAQVNGIEVLAPGSTTPTPTPGAGSVQINAGGPAASPFVADTDFSGGSTASVSNAIDTSGVSNPAPQAVYQSNRYGNFTYTIPGLTANSSYTVRLHFAEEYWTTAGKRVFNVNINGTQVLTNFDIFATAGGEYKAVVEQFSATATGSGTIAIQFVTVTDNAQVNGIEVLAPGSTTPTPTPGAGSVQINAGGPAASPFIADTDFSGGSTASVSNAIDTSGVTNPAPQAVYQSNRYGNFTYTIPGLTANGSYTVRLHFAEEYWTAAGKRVFNVSINGSQVLTNFDIFATAGGEYKAVVEQFSATASGSGSMTIQFVTVTDNAQVNGLEILAAGSSTPTPTPTSTPTPTPTATPTSGPPNFGPNVYIFTPSMSLSQIQSTVNSIANQQVPNQFGTQRYALLFEPGTYGTASNPLNFQVGYYTSVIGLGRNPTDVVINGTIDSYNQCSGSTCNATTNFWRSVSNLT